MRKYLIPLAASFVLVAAPAFAQGSGSSGDIGGANTMGAGQPMSGMSGGGNSKGDAMAPKKMKAKKKSTKTM